ncbi:UDP-2,4-diacetamido-2,4,6-trideoxy-beta-L-altropyranose hydrolase [Asticcacaulis tiandongensis]|uniref:UDP-2,4-diacetamido-2,4, 6-trideoxy-beta-L-altropyranose hydrolase n=1 Tax=Asticcacaulis tiandongensis TaxID=2565365 RepID=UPI00112B1856|nr:UDP-2,4-diacetamido-2,4,6-trideoxy-beta-L-altropyranose hydrolase [Asticcacaulis tiandongensis]
MALWVRTEASHGVGLGHFMRCYAIAEQARLDGDKVTFLTGDLPPQALERLRFAGIDHIYVPHDIGSPEDGQFVSRIAREGQAVLLDSYRFEAGYYARLYETHFVAVMDDAAAMPLKAHVVINAALGARDMGYAAIAPEASLLLGPDFAQVRHEFRRAYPDPYRPHVCVTFGGSDPANLTAQAALALLEAVPDVDIRLIAGPAHAHVDDLRRLCAARPRIKLYLAPDNVAEVLYGADMVITAAGGSLYEIAAMGLPALVLVVVDNQAGALAACPYPALEARDQWPENFEKWVAAVIRNPDIGQTARIQVDGLGCQRILQALPV